MHDDDKQTCASDIRPIIIIDMVYGESLETGSRYLEQTETGCDGERNDQSERLRKLFASDQGLHRPIMMRRSAQVISSRSC